MAGTFWTDEEIEILKKMANAGYSAKQISKVLKTRTINGVNRKAQELDISLGRKKVVIDYNKLEEYLIGEPV